MIKQRQSADTALARCCEYANYSPEFLTDTKAYWSILQQLPPLLIHSTNALVLARRRFWF